MQTKMPTDTELMRKDTAEEIVAHRDRALALYAEAHRLFQEAEEAAAKAAESQASTGMSLHYRQYIGRPHFMESARAGVDKAVWRHLITATSLGDLFDSKVRREFEDKLEKAPPEVTVENLEATMLGLMANAREMFHRSVYDIWRRLHHRYKSHDGVKFGERLIFVYAMGFGTLDYHTEQLIHDLERIVYMVNGQKPPERYGGLGGAIREVKQQQAYGVMRGEAETEHLRCKWFKNQNLHVWVKDPATLEKMNLELARGYELCHEFHED